MGKPRKTHPDGFILFAQSMRAIEVLPDEAAGRAIKAACAYFISGKEMEETQSMEFLAYSVLKMDVDAALARFRETCDRNRENRNHQSPLVAGGYQNKAEQNRTEQNQAELSGTEMKAAPARKSFSELIAERSGAD